MKIFIAYSHCEIQFVERMSNVLSKNGFDVFWDKEIPLGTSWAEVLSNEIAKADVVIIVFSQRKSDHVNKESDIAYTRHISSNNESPLIIPIVIGDDSYVPFDISKFQGIYIKSSNQFDYAIDSLLYNLSMYKAKLKKDKIAAIHAQERIENSLKKHIETVINRLEIIEKRHKIYACILYTLSGIVLISTILIAWLVLKKTDFTNIEFKELALVGFMYLFIAVLIVSFSKFLFSLAKSFMVESIRCSDRIHAISFGQFYIEAFDEKVTRDEIIKIFNTWNIDNGATLFRNQSVEEYDPKIQELISFFTKK